MSLEKLSVVCIAKQGRIHYGFPLHQYSQAQIVSVALINLITCFCTVPCEDRVKLQ